MSAISPFNSTTPALFGGQAKVAAADTIAALKATAQKSAALKAADQKAAANRAATQSPSSVAKANQTPFTPESLAAAEAAMEEWQAGEQRFEQENGFRREANSMIIGMYAHAKTGHFGTAALNSRTDMNDHLDRFFSGFQSDVALINQSGGSLTIGDTFTGYVEKGLGEKGTAVFLAKSQDHLDARRMTLFAETAYVAKSLGLAQPVLTEQDGQVSFTAQDITFQGRAFAHIATDGSLTLLASNPDPNHPDPVDLYIPLNQRV